MFFEALFSLNKFILLLEVFLLALICKINKMSLREIFKAFSFFFKGKVVRFHELLPYLLQA